MNSIQFTHVSGSLKNIPGISAQDAGPRMKNVQKVTEQGFTHTVLEHDYDHVVTVPLKSESWEQIAGPGLDKLPEPVRKAQEQKFAEQILANVEYNQTVVKELKNLNDLGHIKIVTKEFPKREPKVEIVPDETAPPSKMIAKQRKIVEQVHTE